MVDGLDLWLRKFSIELPADKLKKEELFLDELLRWNQRINLTSITDRTEALEKHLLDSLVLLKYLPAKGCLLDMGSGGGLPGIPLAIACPELTVVSVDSVGKKINFQKHIKRLLSLANLQARHQRIEDLGEENFFDVVTARALSNLGSLVAWAAPRQKEGGQLLLMKGPEGPAELDSYLSIKGKEYRLDGVHCYQLPKSGSERQLISLIKTSHLPVN